VTDAQILRTIGGNVRKARLKLNMTQECLAELVGVHWQTISYLENGKHPCSVIHFVGISQALDISPNRLLEGLPEPDRAQIEKTKKVLVRKRKPKKTNSGK